MTTPAAAPGLAGRFASGLRCFLVLQGMNIKSQLAYALDTWIELVLFALHQLTGLAFLAVVFTKVHAVAGWSLAEMVFLYGLLILAMALYRLVFQGVRDTGFLILTGGLDQLLTKPRSPLLLLSCRRSQPSGLGDLITGMALVLLAAGRLDYEWTWARALQLAVFVVSSNAIMVAVMMAQAAACFWVVKFTALHELVMALRRFCYYPLTIYSLPVRVLLCTAVPLAFASYFPAAVLLAKDGLSPWWMLSPPAVAAASLLFAGGLFQLGLRSYESAGS